MNEAIMGGTLATTASQPPTQAKGFVPQNAQDMDFKSLPPGTVLKILSSTSTPQGQIQITTSLGKFTLPAHITLTDVTALKVVGQGLNKLLQPLTPQTTQQNPTNLAAATISDLPKSPDTQAMKQALDMLSGGTRISQTTVSAPKLDAGFKAEIARLFLLIQSAQLNKSVQPKSLQTTLSQLSSLSHSTLDDQGLEWQALTIPLRGEVMGPLLFWYRTHQDAEESESSENKQTTHFKMHLELSQLGDINLHGLLQHGKELLLKIQTQVTLSQQQIADLQATFQQSLLLNDIEGKLTFETAKQLSN